MLKESFYKRYGKEKIDAIIDFCKNKDKTTYDVAKNFNITEKSAIGIARKFEITLRVKTNEDKKKTLFDHYGVYNNWQRIEVREKAKQTCLERYGDPNYNNREKAEATMLERFGVRAYPSYELFDEQSKKTSLEKYGVPYNCMREEARQYHIKSKLNYKFFEIFEADSMEFTIENRQFDLKKENILIEINPTYTHNSTKSWLRDAPLSRTYHRDKTKLAEANGYRCVCVWDWDDVNKLKMLLDTKDKHKYFARNLTLREINNLEEVDIFINTYHLQNTCKNQKIKLGLYDENNTLIQVMTFGKSRYNSKYEYELLRLCTKSDCFVVGGAEKLFNYFIKNYHPTSIVSYCDKSKFNGKIYSQLGFNYLRTTISKHWFNLETKEHILDTLLNQLGYDKLFGTNFGKGTSNRQLMLDAGFLEVYDCGQDTYVWENK